MIRISEQQYRFLAAGAAAFLLLCSAGPLSGRPNMASSRPFTQNSSVTSAELRNTEPPSRIKKLSSENVDMSADSYEYVGSNLIARGHVVIQIKGLQITADSAVVNLVTKDMEASGNVILSARSVKDLQLSVEDYEKYLEDPAVQVTVSGIAASPDGRRAIQAQVVFNNSYMEAERISGSLLTGAFQFRNFVLKANQMFFQGEFAERSAEGQLRLYRSKLSTCEYLLDENAHYSVSASKILLTPREDKRGMENMSVSNDHTILAHNNLFRIWDVPVLWFPILYKPRELSLFGIRFEYGSHSNWGTYVRTRKEFEILDEAALIRAAVNVDYYADRGMGYGASADVFTDNSKTELFAYYINDRNPYESYAFLDEKDTKSIYRGLSKHEQRKAYSRFKIPRDRYEFRFSNLTHLTPRLDFRGQVDVLSDHNFLEDYFDGRYDRDVQPPSFAALEYQADRYSVTLRTDFKVNSFDTTVMRLPELRLDLPRQELFRNLYYQGETSAGYYRMSWRKYDYDRDEYPLLDLRKILTREKRLSLLRDIRRFGNNKRAAAKYLANAYPHLFGGYFEDPENYSAFRFDTLHGFYYPLQFFGALNLIPRAMARFTAYSQSSRTSMNMEALNTLFAANTLDSWVSPLTRVKNYDDDGSAKYRMAFELGLEGNMKFHRTWQEPKNAFLQIDGLRHVIVPYFNVVYIPRPTVNYKRLYYFDDTDLIDREAFIRLGIHNRLQTRRNDRMHEWLSMENFWDFHFEKKDGYNHVGDFGTRLVFRPASGFSFETNLLLDAGRNSDHEAKIYHGREKTGRRGISSNLINSFNLTANYTPSKDWKFALGYYYIDEYTQQSIMSMGSNLTQLNGTSRYRYTFERRQSVSGSVMFPTPDKRLKGVFSIAYDIDESILSDVNLSFRRDFHCWYAAAGVGCSSERNIDDGLDWKYYFNVSLGISAMPFAAYSSKLKAD